MSTQGYVYLFCTASARATSIQALFAVSHRGADGPPVSLPLQASQPHQTKTFYTSYLLMKYTSSLNCLALKYSVL